MRPDYRIVEARPWHVGQILRRMRRDHREGVAAAGVDVHRELRMIFEASSFRRACLLDGKLMALWGMTGTLAESTGYVWAVLAEDATKYPQAIMREARAQLRDMMRQRMELATTILDSDAAARRFAIQLGFHVSHEPAGSPALRRPQRRALAEFLDHDGPWRVKVGGTSVIAMGYH